MKCGCKIVFDQKALKKYGYLAIKDKEIQIISFCPLHSAAEEMLEAAKNAANIFVTDGRFNGEMSAVARLKQAIAKAESHEKPL